MAMGAATAATAATSTIGLASNDALRKMHADITDELRRYEMKQNEQTQSKWKLSAWQNEAFSSNNNSAILCWTSGVLSLLTVLFLFICYAVEDEPKDHQEIAIAIFVLLLTILNFILAGLNSRLRCHEIRNKVYKLLHYLEDCAKRCRWTPRNYPQLNSPLSPCITLQWTFRDGRLVNLHWALLVQGDVIALRPGQIVLGHCRSLDDDEQQELHFGERFVPLSETPQAAVFDEPRACNPHTIKKYILLETPYIKNLRLALTNCCDRPSTILEKEWHHMYLFMLTRILIPVSLSLSLLANCVRYIYLPKNFGHWTEMLILLQLQVLLPLLPLVYPALWLLLTGYGVARLHSFFHSTKKLKSHSQLDLEPFDEYGEILPSIPNCRTSWASVGRHFAKIVLGKSSFPCRTANLVHVLGSVTTLCCVDKKGILSWPNPTAEKVFFLRTPDLLPETSNADSNFQTDDSTHHEQKSHGDPLSDRRRSSSKCKSRYGKSFSRESAVEVLDLTHDNQFPFGLQFDDPDWKQYMKLLKPLGLSILLNTCNPATQDNYSQFTAHIACEVLHNEDVVPVVNRRCLCELARQIGFTDQAMDIFQLQEQLSSFRSMPNILRKDRFAKSLSFTKLKFPFPHMVSVIVKEMTTGMFQLLSQGTGDIILDSCSDYWDGQDLRPLLESDRKKILDFYHRTSLTSYCTAFAYRPLSAPMAENGSSMYLELPADSSNLYPLVRSPTPTKSWDLQSIDCRTKPWWTQYFSTDTLCHKDSEEETKANEVNTYFENQCNQVFIAMVTMQYQARTDVVHLIEYLDKACIRFVHFSKENELRSRVFSEKMGLESGWNCHISLLSERSRNESGNSATQVPSKTSKNVCQLLQRKYCSIGTASKLRKNPLYSRRCMSLSAPTVINLDCSLVKFEDEVSLHDIKHNNGSLNSSTKLNSFDAEEDICSANNSELNEPLFTQRKSDFKIADESSASRSPSHITESTEHSAPVGFDMSNRAKLPKGIENIRPHLKNIDNVPLLVSLFTDCSPDATQEMIKIMQENGEVVCCLGSAANCHNMALFLQADASFAVEPLYPQLCMKEPAFTVPSEECGPSPANISHQLNSFTSSLSFYRDDSVSIFHLIMEARHYTLCFRSCFQFIFACSLSLSFLQVMANLCWLPPPLHLAQIMWLTCVIIPLLSVSLINNPITSYITTMATCKSTDVTRTKIFGNFFCYTATKFVPSMLVCLTCFSFNLFDLCKEIASDPQDCNFIFGHKNYSKPYEWNGWSTEFKSTFRLSQNACSFLIVFYFVCVSMSFVHKHHPIWQKFPLQNKCWCFLSVLVIFLQIIYCTVDMSLQQSELPSLSISAHIWIVSFVAPIFLVGLNELIKKYEISVNVRFQKKARLQFGTKLGMNSPF